MLYLSSTNNTPMTDDPKNKYDEAYERGREDGRNGDLLRDFIHSVSNGLPDTSKEAEKEWKSYDAGYRDGRDDSDNSRSSDSSSSSSTGGCYLTTACVEHKGLPDTCEELSVLREYRDTYLKNTNPEAIRHYYRIAPRIVDAVMVDEHHAEVLDGVYKMICEAVLDIRQSQPMRAFNRYKAKTQELAARYGIE